MAGWRCALGERPSAQGEQTEHDQRKASDRLPHVSLPAPIDRRKRRVTEINLAARSAAYNENGRTG